MINELEYKNPMFTPEFNLDYAIGAINFRDKTIKNLREQIKNLRLGLSSTGVPDDLIDDLQYHHLRVAEFIESIGD